MSYEQYDKITYTGPGPFGAVTRVGDTKFLDSQHDARTGTEGWYVEPIKVGDETWHVTSKTPARMVVKSAKNPDGKAYAGPYVIVHENHIRHHHSNHAAIERPVAKNTTEKN